MSRVEKLSVLRHRYWDEVDNLCRTVEPAMTAFFDAAEISEAFAQVDDQGNRVLTLVCGPDRAQVELQGSKAPEAMLEAMLETGLEVCPVLAAQAAERGGWTLAWLGEFMEESGTLPTRKLDRADGTPMQVQMLELDVPALCP